MIEQGEMNTVELTETKAQKTVRPIRLELKVFKTCPMKSKTAMLCVAYHAPVRRLPLNERLTKFRIGRTASGTSTASEAGP